MRNWACRGGWCKEWLKGPALDRKKNGSHDTCNGSLSSSQAWAKQQELGFYFEPSIVHLPGTDQELDTLKRGQKGS